MKSAGTTRTTKRGHTYHIRRTRLATGLSKVLADTGKKYPFCPTGIDSKYSTLLSLAVNGTTDRLRGIQFKSRWVIKPHPQDPSYTKRVLVLNDLGRNRLRHLRTKRAIP